MQPLDKYKKTFFQECEDRLADLDVALAAIERGEFSQEDLNEAFRAVHSIKGGAAALGFDRLVAFSHVFEATLDALRAGRATGTASETQAIIYAGDVLTYLVDAEQNELTIEADYERAALDLLGTFAEFEPTSTAPDSPAGAPSQSGPQAPDGKLRRFHIAFRPSGKIMTRGIEPLSIIRALQDLGQLTTTVDCDGLPALGDMVASDCYLGWEFELETACGRAEIDEVFDFVAADSDLRVEAVGEPAAASAPEPAANRDAQTGPSDTNGKISSVRVEIGRIDHLVDMVGEIVIAQAMLTERFRAALGELHVDLIEDLAQFERHMVNLQDSVMSIRAQPVGTVFARMPRLVRELAKKTGKELRLEIDGEMTEIDKTVVEELTDPLVHMIRNAVDHGIEYPDERAAAGKPPVGTLRLSAAQSGSRIEILVSDDGRGIDRNAIRTAAIKRGLIDDADKLSEEEIDNLILLPGFSTSETVSDISGRGVGMDVVDTNVKRLGGRLTIQSEPGAGTTMRLTLPLTLAVMDGMIVQIGRDNYVIPLLSIIETVSPSAVRTGRIPGIGEVLNFRGDNIAIIDMAQLFTVPAAHAPTAKLAIVTEVEGGDRLALLVDAVWGQQQIVVKRLDQEIAVTPGIAGATILGDGKVALILDPTAIHDLHNQSRRASVWRQPTSPTPQETVA